MTKRPASKVSLISLKDFSKLRIKIVHVTKTAEMVAVQPHQDWKMIQTIVQTGISTVQQLLQFQQLPLPPLLNPLPLPLPQLKSPPSQPTVQLHHHLMKLMVIPFWFFLMIRLCFTTGHVVELNTSKSCNTTTTTSILNSISTVTRSRKLFITLTGSRHRK